jgi:hypothetical protein
MWLEDPEGFDPAIAQAKYPSVELETIVSWESRWRNWNGDTFTGTDGFPRGSADTPEKVARIKAAIKRARRVKGTGKSGAISRKRDTTALPLPAPPAFDVATPPAERVPTTVHRIIRDTELARRVKMLHRYRCQICGYTMKLNDGSYYAEAHHIQPLGQPHNGPDEIGNIVCVCPNHHAELDYGLFELSRSMLAQVDGHVLGSQYVDYHNKQIFRAH